MILICLILNLVFAQLDLPVERAKDHLGGCYTFLDVVSSIEKNEDGIVYGGRTSAQNGIIDTSGDCLAAMHAFIAIDPQAGLEFNSAFMLFDPALFDRVTALEHQSRVGWGGLK